VWLLTLSAKKIIWIVIASLVILVCICSLVLAGAGLFYGYQLSRQIQPILENYATSTPEQPIEIIRPSLLEDPPVDETVLDMLAVLKSTNVPENDIYDLSCRLRRMCNLPRTVPSDSIDRQVGEKQSFWVTNLDTNKNFQVNATLQYVTPHAYFWIEDGVKYKPEDLKALANAFENKIYPTNREFFGSEWNPGVDSDPHIYVLYAGGLGYSLAGYFSSADSYNPAAHAYSNAHEMFVFNSDNLSLGSQDTYGTLAHEFQHMIHWYQDRNETSWLNEGFSVLAEFLNDYPTGFEYSFIRDPDLQLNDWSPDSWANGPHYGAGFMFTNYFLGRFGNEVTQTLVHDPLNGLESVDNVLNQIDAYDPLSKQPISADSLILDWMIANYLQDPGLADGRYAYSIYPNAPKASPTETIETCPHVGEYRVKQYGADYYRITCRGEYTLTFTGSIATRLLPEDPLSGEYAFWSNKGDESDMTLTRSFDLSAVAGPITLSYWVWYDIEKDYDYVYLEVSEDGQTWDILQTPSGTDEDPSGNSFGWGYNGLSEGWIKEEVDLSQYAGKSIQVRFEYVTDAAVNGEGLLLDDVEIPQIGYSSDFENGDDGWLGAGFVRVKNTLPQTFQLALISKGKAGTQVKTIPLRADQTAELSLQIGEDISDVTLLVTGSTRFTRIPADYRLEIK
jgi:immune inhibitor A